MNEPKPQREVEVLDTFDFNDSPYTVDPGPGYSGGEVCPYDEEDASES